MSLNATQRAVADFARTHDLNAPAEHRLLDLASEVGELAKEALTSTRYGQTSFAPSPGWSGELADALFALICLANATGVDLDQALDDAL